jgi:hypothetical protein
MNCREYDNIIHDLAHPEVISGDIRAKAFEHIEECARCKARLSDIRSLEKALGLLAEAASSEPSPAYLEQILRSEFRERQRGKKSSRPFPVWVAMGAAAALLLSLGVMSRLPIFHSEKESPIVAVVPQPAKAGSDVPDKQMLKPADKLPPAPKNHRQIRPRVPSRGSEGEEFVTRFYALPYAGDSGRNLSGEIVRVSLRGSALPAIGFPVTLSGDRAAEQITADLLLGENGLPLAIRFVR